MRGASINLKMRVFGAMDSMEGKSRVERIRKVAEKVFQDIDGAKHQFTWRTIQTWYCRYQKHGVTGITRKIRKDKGTTRYITPEEVAEAITIGLLHIKDGETPTKALLYKICIKKGLLRKEEIGTTKFYRIVNNYDLLTPASTKSTRRLAFAKPHANDLWQVDTCFGPSVKHKGRNVCAKLIAFIDDASRVICHGQFFASENVDSLMKALQMALYKRGVPRELYTDNGSVYCSKELIQVCSRLGITLRHAPVRDGASKGKIERFFRTVREQFLILKLDLSSISTLNEQFTHWLEDDYNCNEHSVLRMAPIDRFAIDRHLLTFLPADETDDELFYVEADRKVLKDNTFSLLSTRYETPVELANKTIQVRYSRRNIDRVIVYYRDQRLGEARPVDLIGNSNARRPKRKEK